MEINEAMKIKKDQEGHLRYLKEEMKGVKLERMKNSDMRNRRSYTKWCAKNSCLNYLIIILLSEQSTHSGDFSGWLTETARDFPSP